jgi:2-dehydropantoate 2-reductase
MALRIAVFGTGGVGGYLGGLLADSGQDVTFIARGEHLQAMQAHGLQILSVNGDFTLDPVQASGDTSSVGPVDYVIVAVKHYQLQDSLTAIQDLVGADTTIVPLLNGIDAHEILTATFGPGCVVGGFCSLVSMIEAPGVIRQKTTLRRVVIGELDGTRSERLEALTQAWSASGAEAIHTDDIHAAIWTKFLFIAPFGAVSSLSRVPIGDILGCPETRDLLTKAMQEVEAVARAREIALAPDVVESTLEFMQQLEPGATSSMQRDVADGKRFELEAFSGAILRAGREHGIATPAHEVFYALLRPALDRAMGQPD